MGPLPILARKLLSIPQQGIVREWSREKIIAALEEYCYYALIFFMIFLQVFPIKREPWYCDSSLLNNNHLMMPKEGEIYCGKNSYGCPK